MKLAAEASVSYLKAYQLANHQAQQSLHSAHRLVWANQSHTQHRTVRCGHFPQSPDVIQHDDCALQPACYFAMSGRDSSPGNTVH